MQNNRVDHSAVLARKGLRPAPRRQSISRNTSPSAPVMDRLANAKANGFRRSYQYSTNEDTWKSFGEY